MTGLTPTSGSQPVFIVKLFSSDVLPARAIRRYELTLYFAAVVFSDGQIRGEGGGIQWIRIASISEEKRAFLCEYQKGGYTDDDLNDAAFHFSPELLPYSFIQVLRWRTVVVFSQDYWGAYGSC